VRIAWFTTYGGHSGIADFSRHVVAALAARHEVQLWVPEATGRLRAPVAPVVRFTRSPLALTRLHRADAIVYNLGNDVASHRAVAAVARARPGVVVLHDVVMRHFYGGLVADGTWSARRYLRAVALHHGEPAAAAVAASRERAGDLWSAAETWAGAPLFGEAIAGSAGVVVHSAEQEARVRAAWAGPVARLALPAYPCARPAPLPPRAGLVTLVSIGGVSPSRRIDEVVAVLAGRPQLARRVRYVVAGELVEPRYAGELRALIARSGLGDVVRLTGYLRAPELARLMDEAHVFVNLRDPSTEGASASLMAQLVTGRPVLAYDAGSFRDVPAAAAAKVPAGDRDALARALERLAGDPGERARIGAAGAAWATPRTPRAYADGLAAFLQEVARQAPLLALCDRVGQALAPLGDAEAHAAIDAAGEAIATLMP